MKEAFKSKKVYIATAVLAILGLIPLIVAMCVWAWAKPFEGYIFVEWGLVALYILSGFIWGDVHISSYRHKNKNWDGVLPDEVKAAAWKRRLPFFLAAAIIFICVLPCDIYFWVKGVYPFIEK